MANSNIDKDEVYDWTNLDWKINQFAHWPEYIFRGQAQDNWLLESTLSRALKKVKARNKKELVSEHIKNFSLEIRGRRGQNPKTLTENELWALGQHYGLFTPLLDWTESPWVALFFSLVNIEKSETGKRSIWALHKNDIPIINKSFKKKGDNFKNWALELVEPVIDDNSRLVNQRGYLLK
ncbi:MAG: FRG domain-containing protein [Rhizobacter sp.]|nr:FRG domain-containing protein [Ferruginibacter sp.]